jgi:peptidoglycan hydrolase-like protein with peptidoglycan-binding domain
MRITHNQLRQLIRETLTRVIITDEDFLDKIKSEGGIRRGDEGQHVEYAQRKIKEALLLIIRDRAISLDQSLSRIRRVLGLDDAAQVDVNVLQRLSDDIVADGVFGRKTQAGVMAFQDHRGLEVDGVIGPITATELVEFITSDGEI